MEYSLSLQMSSTESTGEEIRLHKPPHASLHGIRKPPAKPWRRPDLPQPPKVYRVDPHGFRRLVQRLTGKPQPQSITAQVTAPAPIKVEQQRPAVTSEMNQTGFLSPSFYSSLCSFPLLSPGSMAALESLSYSAKQ